MHKFLDGLIWRNTNTSKGPKKPNLFTNRAGQIQKNLLQRLVQKDLEKVF